MCLLLSCWARVGLLACAVAACPVAPAASESAALLRSLDAEIGSADCQRASQCRTVAVGHRACGGPEAYRAYSTAGGREPQILALAKAQAEARRHQDEAQGRLSTCQLLADPGAVCSPAGHCVLGAAAAGVQ